MLSLNYSGSRLEAGCDEAGRGCLAGPVCAAAVILPSRFYHPLLNDSKQCTPSLRATLRSMIEQQALAYAVAWASPIEIDTINILQASILAMHRAVRALSTPPDWIAVDGNYFKPYDRIPYQCLIKGDARFANIAAASILAKTYRDDYMQTVHKQYPLYGWNQNKGYGTKKHVQALQQHGTTPHHRLSFKLKKG